MCSKQEKQIRYLKTRIYILSIFQTGIQFCFKLIMAIITTVKRNQRHTTNEKPNMYLDIFNKGVEEVSHWH